MALPKYKSFQEKRKYFHLYFPKNITELEYLFQRIRPYKDTRFLLGKEISVEKRFLYRGVNNASFMMYSSIHRCLDQRLEKYHQEMTLPKLMEEIYIRFHRDNNLYLYNEYRKQMPKGAVSSDPSIWAFIQHFEGPSPLLDFTSDLESALFFAFDRVKPAEPNDEMSEYVSLFIFPDNPMRTSEVTSMYAETFETATSMVIQHEQATGEIVDTDAYLIQSTRQPLNQIAWGSMVYGNRNSYHSFHIPDAENSEVFSAVDNINISAQNGNFFQGNIIESLPMETAPNIIRASQDGRYGSCIEIHKSMIEEIKNKYEIPSRTEVYPDKEGRLEPLYSAMRKLWEPYIGYK